MPPVLAGRWFFSWKGWIPDRRTWHQRPELEAEIGLDRDLLRLSVDGFFDFFPLLNEVLEIKFHWKPGSSVP